LKSLIISPQHLDYLTATALLSQWKSLIISPQPPDYLTATA
jgi:hypothetical protein